MRGLWTATRAAFCLATIALAGCENETPTGSGLDLFPEGTAPTSVEVVLPAGQFIVSDTVYEGFSSLDTAPYLLVANRFDGALDARALVRFTGFPDSVTFTSGGTTRTDPAVVYGTGRVVARVDSLNSTPRSPVVLRLYELAQAWDSAAVSWQNASNGATKVAWRTPGGTLGPLLAEGTWVPGDTARKDSVIWQIDSVSMRRVAAKGHPGLAVVPVQENSRLQLSQLTLSTGVHPASKPDTLLAQTIVAGPQTFIYTPELSAAAGVYRTGGPTGARTVLRLRLDQPVPACPPPSTGCGTVPLREVTLNQARIVLTPVAVPQGFRPLSYTSFQLRRVVEPELGRLAPLGDIVAAPDTATASLFQAPAGRSYSIDVTNAIRASSDSTSLTVAILNNTATSSFGAAWFARSPQLRLLYTLPLKPTLP